MNREELYEIAKDAVNDAELRSSDIPPIDLYVDQILNLMAERIAEGSERYHERQLTKTMINNYSKDGLITPVKGKKYNKEQILQMLTIYTLKGTLSIGEIKRLLKGAYDIEGFDGKMLMHLYDRHQDTKNENRVVAMEALNEMLDDNLIDIENDVDYISVIFSLASLSAHLRNMAQAMIDAKFPEISEVEEEERDKEKEKEEKKGRKEEKKADKKQKKENKTKNKE